MRTSLFFAAATALLSSSQVLRSEAQQLCNGYADLCARTYDKVVYATAHNAYAHPPPNALAINQNNDIPTQLKDGIRGLMLDAYAASNPSDVIELCHTSCKLFDGGPLSSALGAIKKFLDANPNEVITIFWENAGKLTPAQFESVYQTAGMSNYLYTQTTGTTTWPTLAEIISSGKRLVNFVDSGADASVPWLMSEYDFVFETPYQIQAGGEYPCTIDRPKDERRQMYVLNHFISRSLGDNTEVPQPGAAPQTNGPDLVSHANNCQTVFNQVPNFVAVDFYEKGTVLQTVAQLNGVTWNNKSPTQPKSTTSGNGVASVKDGVNIKAVGMIALTAALGLLTL